MPYKPNEREYRAAEPFTLPDENNKSVTVFLFEDVCYGFVIF